jgi:hypothetical protein
MNVGISLGWNCDAAVKGSEIGIRKMKADGYKTCPFDLCLTNYKGIVECINDDFKYFMDSAYLSVCEPLIERPHFNPGDLLIYNKKYNFIFPHESPWETKNNYYIENDFNELKIKYNNRVNNFREYITNNYVTFIIIRYNKDISELRQAIKNTYNKDLTTNYNILFLDPNDSNIFNKTLQEHHGKDSIKKHLQFMGMNYTDIENELTE